MSKRVALYLNEVSGQKIFDASPGIGGYGAREGTSNGYGHVHRSALPILVPGVAINLNGTFPLTGKVVIETITSADFDNEGNVTGLEINVRYFP